MIFVTVGSQKFPFNRLLMKVDELVKNGVITEETVMQTGASDFVPEHCRYQKFYDRKEHARLMEECTILITHGGVGTMIEAVRKGKKTIVVPRLMRYREHVNDHQLEVMNKFHAMHLVYACPDVEKLPKALSCVCAYVHGSYPSNTEAFIASVEASVRLLAEEGRGKRGQRGNGQRQARQKEKGQEEVRQRKKGAGEEGREKRCRKGSRILVIGPSETGSCGGIAEVIRGIRESKVLGRDFKIDSYPSYIDGSLPVRLWYSAYAYARFLPRVQKYDLFHIHVAERGSTFRKNLYLQAAKRAGKKVIVHVHGAEYLDFYDGLGQWGKRVVRRFFQRADRVLVLSERWKKELNSRIPLESYRVLHNGIDTACFSSAVLPAENDSADYSPPALPAEKFRNSFLMLGRLGKRKGTYDLIDAVELAVQKNPEIKLYLAGDGEVEKVREYIAQKGLEKHIAVLGWIGREEKLRCLNRVATLVLPSYDEGLPMAILEGMAAGKAIISTTVGAIPEVVGTENGILICPGDVEALEEGLLRCSEDIAMLKEMSIKNREKAERSFDIRQMHRQLAGHYREVSGVLAVGKGGEESG